MLRAAIILAGLLQASVGLGQTPLREAPERFARTTTIANFPTGTFLENLIATPKGDLIVTSHLEHALYRVSPSGTRKRFATLPGKATGIASNGADGYIVSGWTATGKSCVYEVSSNGSKVRTTLQPNGQFPNGVIAIGKHRFLVADSYAGSIWVYNASRHESRLWLRDKAFDRADLKNGTPGINGIRIQGSYLYFSNTNAQMFGRVHLTGGTTPHGKAEILTKGVNFDDFALDNQGNVYATTHILNSVQKLTPAGQLTTLAALPQGLAGSTSLVFGRANGLRKSLFVTTNGGLSLPPAGGVQNAKIIRIDL